ncbi:amidohydrolase family protein [Geomicrobium sediminis]|uniref:5-methylthioadenosine/S-adenosylhomocysteine deaminase n=1 Tax=Geomicrobium sediminis TaxID=1347788 RepID=A0ABS2PGC6_9BACL|nr:amidohydrolase family protein [Geomicrobium sediminis]MBM7634337.1 5-methylthioadenosine/S-adenosylhomocysteine deaminase [Geomicrobium sediminis]
MRTIDVMFVHATIFTMEGEGVGSISDGAICVHDNLIVAVGKSSELMNDYRAHRTIDAAGKVILPGLIDAHMHSGLGILRGVAQDTNDWMEKGLWPFMHVLDEPARKAGSLVNLIEAVKAGTTTICDYDSGMLSIVENHRALGTRARVCEMINEMPEQYDDDREVGALYDFDPAVGEETYQANRMLFETYHERDNGRITCVLGPQGPDMMSTELLLDVNEYARKHNTLVHMHVAQGDREITQMIQRYGKRSIDYLQELNLLDKSLMAVHLTEATKEEVAIVAKSGASMILCSGSIGIIDGIVPPAKEFLDVSQRFALGSDQAPGNNCNNMFNEMKLTSILNKCKYTDPTLFPAWKMLRSVTIDSAKAIGLDHEVGSLSAGKKADLIMIDLKTPALFPTIESPIRNIVPNLVYSANGSEVELVMIDGKIIVEDSKLQSIDEQAAINEGQRHADRISADVSEQPKPNTPIFQMMANDQL